MTFVKKHWDMDFSEMHANFNGGRPDQLSQESKNIAISATGKRKRSLNSVASEIMEKRSKKVSKWTIRRFYKKQGIKPLSIIKKPVLTNNNKENRLWFCDFLREWKEDHFLHVAASDEFFIYCTRKSNSKTVLHLSPQS